MPFLNNEEVLPEDHFVGLDYVYIADGKIVKSTIEGTVRDLKRVLKAREIRNCSICDRLNMKVGDSVG